ncbi:histidine kinase dimerization/phospho-acceptor domain-containing protein [Microvirga aerilata]|uniref:histidine kinase dimerization/phospho-acceptor domain-containing protein n=1 Tax=Microvirga aerilata TaxID=670292 RepID=UPI00362C0C1A
MSERQTNARLSHVRQELLAPVNAIAGYADILRDEATRLGLPALMPDIERVLESAEALLGLVEGLLDAGTTLTRREGRACQTSRNACFMTSATRSTPSRATARCCSRTSWMLVPFRCARIWSGF